MFEALQDYLGGNRILALWMLFFVITGIAVGIAQGFFRARKIQPKGFRWEIFRKEILFAIISITVSATIISFITNKLWEHGIITSNKEPASGWVIFLEFTLSFFMFDTYFYWLHRWMHQKPVYKWVHKLHHMSTSPNFLTTLSVHPLESLINGGFVPLFLSVFTVHDDTLKFITPCNIIMGLYVHSGYEFLPRWWNKSWLTKWFITTTFHDQHHKYFNYNYGGYTPIWDYICGTVRAKYESDFDQLKARVAKPVVTPAAAANSNSEGPA
ncbi:MAG TPA: sterol desaturase family protein [Spongiibacteraceae bacterium]|nr:sterol desaturase family protein [Spongiibacteraceae bacterium]